MGMGGHAVASRAGPGPRPDRCRDGIRRGAQGDGAVRWSQGERGIERDVGVERCELDAAVARDVATGARRSRDVLPRQGWCRLAVRRRRAWRPVRDLDLERLRLDAAAAADLAADWSG